MEMNEEFKKKIAGEDKGAFTVNAMGVPAETPAAMVCLWNTVVFPYSLASVALEKSEDIAALHHALHSDRRLLAVFYRLPEEGELEGHEPESFFHQGAKYSSIGTLARVVKHVQLPDGSLQVVLRGLKRIVRGSGVESKSGADFVPLVRYQAHIASDGEDKLPSMLARQDALRSMFMEFAGLHPGLPDEFRNTVINSRLPSRTSDHLADGMSFSDAEKFLLLTMPELKDRMDFLTVLLNREIEVAKLGIKIHAEVQESMGDSQREFYLREQLKSIKRELGEMGCGNDVQVLTQRLEESNVPPHVAETILNELSRLEVIPQNAPEYHISYNYINWLLDIPWNTLSVVQAGSKAYSHGALKYRAFISTMTVPLPSSSMISVILPSVFSEHQLLIAFTVAGSAKFWVVMNASKSFSRRPT